MLCCRVACPHQRVLGLSRVRDLLVVCHMDRDLCSQDRDLSNMDSLTCPLDRDLCSKDRHLVLGNMDRDLCSQDRHLVLCRHLLHPCLPQHLL